jgi:hypothetical protein
VRTLAEDAMKLHPAWVPQSWGSHEGWLKAARERQPQDPKPSCCNIS